MKNSNLIEITVTGRAGTGKTTIAELLFELLGKEGFEEVIHVPMEKLAESFYTEESVQRRRESVVPNTRIIIREKSALRSGVEDVSEHEEYPDRAGGILHKGE